MLWRAPALASGCSQTNFLPPRLIETPTPCCLRKLTVYSFITSFFPSTPSLCTPWLASRLKIIAINLYCDKLWRNSVSLPSLCSLTNTQAAVDWGKSGRIHRRGTFRDLCPRPSSFGLIPFTRAPREESPPLCSPAAAFRLLWKNFSYPLFRRPRCRNVLSILTWLSPCLTWRWRFDENDSWMLRNLTIVLAKGGSVRNIKSKINWLLPEL